MRLWIAPGLRSRWRISTVSVVALLLARLVVAVRTPSIVNLTAVAGPATAQLTSSDALFSTRQGAKRNTVVVVPLLLLLFAAGRMASRYACSVAATMLRLRKP